MGRRAANVAYKIVVTVAIGAAIAFSAAMFAGGAGEKADATSEPETETVIREATATKEVDAEPELESEPVELKAVPEAEAEIESESAEIESEPGIKSEAEIEIDAEPWPDSEQEPEPDDTGTENEENATPTPWTDADVEMLAKLMYAEAGGVHDKKQQAAIAWCVLNRLDEGSFGDTIAEVITAPEQFAWHTNMVTTDAMRELAEDVLNRWWAEKQGATDFGRVLPSCYLYFDGDGVTNHFHVDWQGQYSWGWTLPDPYSEEG